MSGVQVKPVRASSARAPVIRPQSSKNRKLQQKTQFIQNMYVSSNPNNPLNSFHSFQKNKHFFNRFNASQNETQEISKLIPRAQQMNKQRQELFEQNLHLKKQLNRMRDQMMKSRTKIQNLTSKNQKYTKQFNRQFEKKMYWNGTGNNSYLISGVKAQYQKLRQQFNQKQQLCEALKRQLIQSRAPQYKIYAQTLQEQNKKLNQRINKMAQVSQNILFDNSDEKNKSYNDYMYTQLQNKLQKIDQKYKQSQLNLKTYKQQCKDLQKKVEFLQRLIIQKDNAQYHAVKKVKKLEREKHTLDQKIKSLQHIQSQISKNYQIKIQKLKIMEQKRFKVEKDIFDRTIHQKDIKIQKLQKQVAYLSTLLTYWKPLDELNRESNQRFAMEKQQSESYIKQQQEKRKKNDDSFFLDQKNLGSSTRVRKATQFEPKADFVLKNSVEISRQSNKFEKKARVQQTAQKKHNQDAQKRRRVDYKQIQHLGEHLRYRFLGLRLHIKQVRKYFDYQKQSSNPQTNFVLENDPKAQKQEIEPKWQEQYITMKQVKDILKQSPFQLLQQQAHILARYMIQDTTNEFVYVDLNNQHKRSVVKSILKALVGQYQILGQESQLKVEKECQQMLNKYHSNLLAALSTMASSGYISRKKFVQLINSLGIELSEQGKDLLVCKMLLKSQNLNKLSYMIILE